MASSKISELVDAGNFLPGDDTIIVRGGANFKVDPTKNAVNAWVNFNGTSTVAIRASYNVSSITDLGTGQYRVNFTNALTDANYALVGSAYNRATSSNTEQTTSAARVWLINTSGSFQDSEHVSVVIIR
jgi:hypothetical protein